MSKQTVLVSVLADTNNFSKNMAKVGTAAAAGFAIAGAAVVAFMATSIKAAAESEKVAAQTNAAIASTGGAAGRTAEQVGDLATKLSRVSGIDDEVIQSGQNLLLTFTQIQGVNFDKATQAALDLSVAMGTDMSSAATLVGKALNDPIKGISALSRVGVQLTADQKALIKSMVESGDVAGAQAVIFGELQTQFGGSAEAFGSTFLGTIERIKNGFGNIQEIIGSAFLPVLTAVFDKVATVLEGVADSPAFNAFITNMSAWITSLLSGDSAIGGLIGQLAPLLSMLTPFGIILQVLKPLVPQLAEGLGQVAKVIGGTLTAVLPVVMGLLQSVIGILSGALAAILPKLIPLIVTIAEVFGTVLAAVLPVVATLLQAVVTVIEALLPVVLPIIDAVLGVVQAFLPLIGVLAGLIGPLLEPLIDLLVALLVPILDLIAPLLELLAPAIKFVAEVLAFLIGIVVEVITWFVSLIGGSEEAKAGVTRVWQGILDFFSGVPAAIGGFFGAAGQWLVSAGQNIVNGLLNGLRNAIGAVWDFISSVGQNIADTFASVLGIRSPSRVFQGMGTNIIKGLEKGLDGRNRLDRIMDGLTSQVTGGFNAELAVPSGYRAAQNSPAPVINFNGLVTDPASAGREVKRVLDDYYRFGGAA